MTVFIAIHNQVIYQPVTGILRIAGSDDCRMYEPGKAATEQQFAVLDTDSLAPAKKGTI